MIASPVLFRFLASVSLFLSQLTLFSSFTRSHNFARSNSLKCIRSLVYTQLIGAKDLDYNISSRPCLFTPLPSQALQFFLKHDH